MKYVRERQRPYYLTYMWNIKKKKKPKQKKCKLIYGDRKQTSGALRMGQRVRGRRDGLQRILRKLLMWWYVHYLFVVMVSQLYAHIRTDILYILNMCHLLYINYNVTKLLKSWGVEYTSKNNRTKNFKLGNF